MLWEKHFDPNICCLPKHLLTSEELFGESANVWGSKKMFGESRKCLGRQEMFGEARNVWVKFFFQTDFLSFTLNYAKLDKI